MFLTVLGVTFFFGALGFLYGPNAYPLALLLLVVTCVAAFLRPVIGVYLMLFLGLIGDTVTTGWWPFLANLSSRESVLFVDDRLILSPLEVVAAVTTAGWLLRGSSIPPGSSCADGCSGRSWCSRPSCSSAS